MAAITEDEMMNAEMYVSDATNMFRTKIPNNCKPYDEQVIRHNNNLVDRWGTEMLSKIGKISGKVQAKNVYPSWVIYATGNDMPEFANHLNRFASVSDENLNYWIETFKKSSTAELCKLGVTTVRAGWETLMLGLTLAQTKRKYDTCYAGSSDPSVWSSKCNENKNIAFDTQLPLGLTNEEYSDMRDKYNAVMRNIPRIRS